MGSKTISIKDDAYERLKALKTGKKSFSDVILELTGGETKNFENIIGKGIAGDFEDLKEIRKRTEKDEKRENLLRRH